MPSPAIRNPYAVLLTEKPYLLVWNESRPRVCFCRVLPSSSPKGPPHDHAKEWIPSRRDFLKTSMAAAAGTAALGGLSLARSAHAAGSDVIASALIGCGSRGPGAAVNAMNADPGVRLVAMTDIFADRVQSRREMLKKQKPDQVEVDDAHCFSGLDGYKHVIEASTWC